MPVVSVIIPVYNSSHYLRGCLDDICAQSFSDWECLLIDDGSTDESGEICDEYATKDSRFNAFHIINSGASGARNYGINRASGKWIAFVDSDDKVLANYLANLINAVESSKTDVVLSNYGGRQEDILINENCRLSGVEMIDYFLKNKIFALSAPYGKLYKRQIVEDNNIHFPEGIHMGEDMIFFGKYMNCIDSAFLIKDSSYIVNSVEDSLSKRYYYYESEFNCFELWKNEIFIFVSRGNYCLEECENLIWDNRTAGAFFRYFESMYKGPVKLSLYESLQLMKKIPASYYPKLKIFFHPNASSAKIKSLLLANRMYLTYLLLGRILLLIGK